MIFGMISKKDLIVLEDFIHRPNGIPDNGTEPSGCRRARRNGRRLRIMRTPEQLGLLEALGGLRLDDGARGPSIPLRCRGRWCAEHS